MISRGIEIPIRIKEPRYGWGVGIRRRCARRAPCLRVTEAIEVDRNVFLESGLRIAIRIAGWEAVSDSSS